MSFEGGDHSLFKSRRRSLREGTIHRGGRPFVVQGVQGGRSSFEGTVRTILNTQLSCPVVHLKKANFHHDPLGLSEFSAGTYGSKDIMCVR